MFDDMSKCNVVEYMITFYLLILCLPKKSHNRSQYYHFTHCCCLLFDIEQSSSWYKHKNTKNITVINAEVIFLGYPHINHGSKGSIDHPSCQGVGHYYIKFLCMISPSILSNVNNTFFQVIVSI